MDVEQHPTNLSQTLFVSYPRKGNPSILRLLFYCLQGHRVGAFSDASPRALQPEEVPERLLTISRDLISEINQEPLSIIVKTHHLIGLCKMTSYGPKLGVIARQ
jgi:hypothetical protein